MNKLTFLASLVLTFALLCTLWCTASQATECERRALANDVAGQYVVTCEGGHVTAPMGPARHTARRSVRRVVGSTTIMVGVPTHDSCDASVWSEGVRVGCTIIVARMGARG